MNSPILLSRIAVIEAILKKLVAEQIRGSRNPNDALNDWNSYLTMMSEIARERVESNDVIGSQHEYKLYLAEDFEVMRDDILDELSG